MLTVLSIFGTRPEAVKLAPVIHELEARAQLRSKVCVTGQHREMLTPFLKLFAISPDFDLNVMHPNQDLFGLTARLIEGLRAVLETCHPDIVLVQGDTTTAFVGSLAAYYQKTPVGHVEAGLRSLDKYNPFPEEINRQLADQLSDYLFAPTPRARDSLMRAGHPDSRVFVTGNTVIDALHWVLERLPRQPDPGWNLPCCDNGHRMLLVTGHRRESFGSQLEQICMGLKSIVERHTDVEIIYPVHLNPNVCQPVARLLGGVKRIHLIEPLDYLPFVYLMKRAHLILTDSGGVQEEAPALGKPVLVMREVTERSEGIEAGAAKLIGTRASAILEETSRLLDDEPSYASMAQAANPYGDGQSAKRIVDILENSLLNRR